MKIKDIPIKQNANQVTDPNTQVSAEEFNALVDNAKESVTSMEVLVGQEEVKLSYGKGKGTSSALTFPTATGSAAGMMSPKQASRIADRTATDGMGYVVLEKGKSFAEQVTQENTIYEIRYEFDLGGGANPIQIHAGCVLKFEGGSLKNGTIKGTNTVLSGVSISVDKMSGSFACDIRSSYSSMTCDHSKLAMLLALGVNKVIIDEDYTIGSGTEIQTTIPYIIGEGATFDIKTDLTRSLIYATSASEIKGLSFNHNRHGAQSSLFVVNKGDLKVSDISVSNIHTPYEYPAGILSIYIQLTNEGIIHVSDLNIKDLSALGSTEDIGTGIGQVVGLLVRQQHLMKNSVLIDNVNIENLITYDNDNPSKILLVDGSGVYVTMEGINKDEYESSVRITNVRGVNYGKRLIKSDCNNIIIDGIDAKQTIANQGLAVVGLNNSDCTLLGEKNNAHNIKGASVRNIKFRGSTSYVVACAISDVYIENVDAKMYTGDATNVAEGADNTFMGLVWVGPYAHNVAARNIYAENCCLVNNTSTKAIVKNPAGEDVEDEVDREDQIILQNVTCVKDEGIVPSQKQTFLNITRSNVLIENISIKTNLILSQHQNKAGKVIIKGIKLANTMANTNNNWTIANPPGDENSSFEIYDFDIEVRRGLFSLYNPKKVVLKNGTVRVNMSSGFYPQACGVIYCDGSSDINIEDVNIVNEGESAINSDLWINNTTNNAQKVNVRNSLSSINSANNAYWEDAPLTVSGTPALNKGLVIRYILQGHFTGDFRYMDSGFELISHKSISYAAAQAWSSNTTVPPQVGVQIYLSDKGKTAWWNGSAWVDAMGAMIE
jgi:hypothetical protein